MEIRVLKYFIEVAREENITAAANKLHLTQPTLSKQLMALEDELGKQLFIRGKRKITLTEDGVYLFNRAKEIVDLAEKTEADLKANDKIIEGSVAIGGGETSTVKYVAKAAKHLRNEYPKISFDIFSGNGENVARWLDKGLVDFGLFVGSTDLKKYDYIKLPESNTWGLLMKKDDPLAENEFITPKMLKDIPLLCSRQVLIQNEMTGWLGISPEKLNIVATYNLIYNASVMVEQGMGCALAIDGLINTGSDSALCFRPLKPSLKADVIIAWKKYRSLSKAASKFLEFLQNEIH